MRSIAILTAILVTTLSRAGEPYVLVSTHNSVVRLHLDGSLDRVLIDASDPAFSPQGLAIGPDGLLYVSNYFGGVKAFDLDTGAPIRSLRAGSELSQPTWLGVRDNELVVSSAGTSRILRYDLDDADALLGDLADPARLNRPQAIVWEPDGSFIVSNGDQTIRRFRPDGTQDRVIYRGSPLNRPLGMAYAHDRSELWIANFNAGASGLQAFEVLADGTLGFDRLLTPAAVSPDGIALLPNGNLLVGFHHSRAVWEYEPDGAFVGVFADANEQLGRVNQILVVPAPQGSMLILIATPAARSRRRDATR